MIIGYEAKRIFHNASGLGNYSRNLIRALAQHYPDHRYLLYNPKEGSVPFGQFLPGVEEQMPAVKNPLYANLWRQRFLSDRARKDQVDVFHGLSAELPSGLRQKGIPSVVTVHDLIFMRYPGLYKSIDRKIYGRKLKAACKRADQVVAISQQTKRDLVEMLGLDPLEVRVIYQGCDPIFWKRYSADEREEARQRWDLPERYALFVGTLEERKGVERLLEAVRTTRIPLVLVGRPTVYWQDLIKRYSDIRDLIHTPEVPENEDLAKLYHRAEFFIYPSIFEGFGIPVLEALICGTPVITSNVSSLPEAAGPSSLLVNPLDQDEINQAMTRLWEDEELRREMAATGHDFAVNFSDERIAESWMHVYESLKS